MIATHATRDVIHGWGDAMEQIRRFLNDCGQIGRVLLQSRREGQGMSEYAMILAGVAAIAIIAIDRFDAALGALFSRIAASLS
jgi:Flp pilus assembly pilin Flp